MSLVAWRVSARRILSAPSARFKMEKNNRPIEEAPLTNKLNVKISRSAHLVEWDAAIAAGATLDELYKWEQGEYPGWFRALVIVWYERKNQYEAHVEAARAQHMERKSKC